MYSCYIEPSRIQQNVCIQFRVFHKREKVHINIANYIQKRVQVNSELEGRGKTL